MLKWYWWLFVCKSDRKIDRLTHTRSETQTQTLPRRERERERAISMLISKEAGLEEGCIEDFSISLDTSNVWMCVFRCCSFALLLSAVRIISCQTHAWQSETLLSVMIISVYVQYIKYIMYILSTMKRIQCGTQYEIMLIIRFGREFDHRRSTKKRRCHFVVLNR